MNTDYQNEEYIAPKFELIFIQGDQNILCTSGYAEDVKDIEGSWGE